jgi:ribosomal protein S18 acetylase RimI-like enzyme
MEKIEIRKATIKDIYPLQTISKQTFLETFSASNSVDDMTAYLDEHFSVEQLLSELINDNSEFHFATLHNDIIGYLKINFGEAQTELQDSRAIEIERIYVLKTFHGKHVGQHLIEKAIQISKIRKAEYIWLGVWEENERAIGFYTKNGFKAFDTHLFRLGNDEQTDIMMKLVLTEGE